MNANEPELGNGGRPAARTKQPLLVLKLIVAAFILFNLVLIALVLLKSTTTKTQPNSLEQTARPEAGTNRGSSRGP